MKQFQTQMYRNAQWSAERDHEFHNMRETGIKNLMLNKFLGVFRKFDNLDEVCTINFTNKNIVLSIKNIVLSH